MALASVQPRLLPSESNAIDRADGCCWSARYTAGRMISTAKNRLPRRESAGDGDKSKMTTSRRPTMRALVSHVRCLSRKAIRSTIRSRPVFGGVVKGKCFSYFDRYYLLSGQQGISSEIDRSFFTLAALLGSFLSTPEQSSHGPTSSIQDCLLSQQEVG